MSGSFGKTVRVASRLGLTSCVGMLALMQAGRAFAAEGAPASDTRTLEEVVVTAQRHQENLQSVPIAITTISGADLVQRGVTSLQSLTTAVPSLAVAGTFSTQMYLRGIGTNSTSPNNEPSVSTYVDGVYMPASYGLTGFAFNDFSQIEVLRGPQGTLFGRNATAGVVLITTSDPKQDFGGKLGVGYGNYDTTSANGYVTGGLTPNLAGDLAVLFENEDGGYGFNPTLGQHVYVYKKFAARSKWLFTPWESTKVSASVDYSMLNSDQDAYQVVPGGIATDGKTVYYGKYITVGNTPTVNNNKQAGASVRVDEDLGLFHGVSITSYRDVSGHWKVDNDLTPQSLAIVENFSKADYWTQEFQLSNWDKGKIEWLVGAFFYGNHAAVSPQATTGTKTSPCCYSAAYGDQRTNSGSLYGQATAEILDATKLTLGLRYTDETLTTNGFKSNIAGKIISGPFPSSIHFEPTTWRIALDHQFTADLLGYVSYNRGFKSGGYNLSSPGTVPFFPETVDAYEVGFKSELLDHRMRLNVAAFYYDYQNVQVAIVPGGGSQIFTNAAAARNQGIDATLEFLATENLRLSLGASVLDAKFNSYPNAQIFTNKGASTTLANASGFDLPHAPPFSGDVSATYHLPTSIGGFDATASLSYQDRSYIQPSIQPRIAAHTLLNASLEWQPEFARSWTLSIWGKNLLKAYYADNLLASANSWYQIPAPPLTYGVTATVNF